MLEMAISYPLLFLALTGLLAVGQWGFSFPPLHAAHLPEQMGRSRVGISWLFDHSTLSFSPNLAI
jgi:hypothetical protein